MGKNLTSFSTTLFCKKKKKKTGKTSGEPAPSSFFPFYLFKSVQLTHTHAPPHTQRERDKHEQLKERGPERGDGRAKERGTGERTASKNASPLPPPPLPQPPSPNPIAEVPPSYPALPRVHSVVHLFRHASFQAGTWCGDAQTARWQASAHASSWAGPQTVTHDCGAASRERPPMRRSRRGEAQTRSQTKEGSEGSSTGLFRRFFFF